MRIQKQSAVTRGWIAGAFTGAMVYTESFEVGLKSGVAHVPEAAHYHTCSYEHTLILRGECTIRSVLGVVSATEGDMITLRPNETAEWDWSTDWATLVIRTPSITNDKVEI